MIKFVFSIFIGTFFFSCQSDVLFDENIAVSARNWEATDTLKYEVDIIDTTSKYDLSLSIRHRDVYDFMNLYIKIKTIFPTGEEKIDVISLPLCDESGKWLGKCSGDVCYNKVYLQKKLYFKNKGIHRFEINQEMRQEKLENILDLGLKIEKSPQKIYHEGED